MPLLSLILTVAHANLRPQATFVNPRPIRTFHQPSTLPQTRPTSLPALQKDSDTNLQDYAILRQYYDIRNYITVYSTLPSRGLLPTHEVKWRSFKGTPGLYRAPPRDPGHVRRPRPPSPGRPAWRSRARRRPRRSAGPGPGSWVPLNEPFEQGWYKVGFGLMT